MAGGKGDKTSGLSCETKNRKDNKKQLGESIILPEMKVVSKTTPMAVLSKQTIDETNDNKNLTQDIKEEIE